MRWLYKYDVNKYIRGAKSSNEFKEVAKKIFDDLNGKAGFEGFKLTKLLTCEDVNEFDEVWNDLYDYADMHRIWLGI